MSLGDKATMLIANMGNILGLMCFVVGMTPWCMEHTEVKTQFALPVVRMGIVDDWFQVIMEDSCGEVESAFLNKNIVVMWSDKKNPEVKV